MIYYNSDEYERLSENAKRVVTNWIKDNLKPTESINYNIGSYGLSELMYNDINVSCTHDQFKGAMLQLDYYPSTKNKRVWNFRISQSKINQTRKRMFRDWKNGIEPLPERDVDDIE